jgi:HSP20 family protein
MATSFDHRLAAAGRGKTNRRRKRPMTESEQTTGTMDVEETIGRMEHLYQALTGAGLPRTEGPYAPIPAEKDPAEHVEKQMNRLLTLLGDLGGDIRPVPLTSWTPAMSVWESHTEIRICVDLPGVPRDQVQVVAQGKVLTISGQRSIPRNDDFRLHSSESPIGPFRRAVYIPAGMRQGEPRAEMKDGVLEIRIQKESSQITTPKNVPVN